MCTFIVEDNANDYILLDDCEARLLLCYRDWVESHVPLGNLSLPAHATCSSTVVVRNRKLKIVFSSFINFLFNSTYCISLSLILTRHFR